jgi:hypothetical protein
MEKRIDITALEAGAYGVQVTDGTTTTSHRVEVTSDILGAVAPGEQPGQSAVEETLVRESIEFLLEREPADEIHDDFRLSDISRYFPDYSEEIVNRVAAQA